MFNPASASKKIKEEFINYLTTSFRTCDDNYNAQFKALLESEISKGPYVEISDIFKTGNSLNKLIDENIISPYFRLLEVNKPKGYEIEVPLDRPLFKHQEKALRKAVNNKNIIVTTGTGSGKTESFLYPVLNKLFKEQEERKLGDHGVRAILIYPMNALANDQIKRIRDILMFYPDISFGVFTGDTIKNQNSAKNKYREIHAGEKYPELQRGLENERISREEMYDKPPHILITNYVMLEYLLLRPDYSGVFKDSDLKFIVLDESHVYRGATGIEMSMLLRKLRARLGKAEEGVQYILTSATLGEEGESEPDIANFAYQLTNEPFDEKDIIFGERMDPDLDEKIQNKVPIEVWGELAENEEDINIKNIFEKYGITYNNSFLPEENVYSLCHDSELYYQLRHKYSVPIEIDKMAKWIGISTDDAVAFLFVCSKTTRNGFPLLDIHYHFFVRALEGAYATLSGEKKLFLDRLNHIDNPDGTKDMVFEIARCTSCGDIAIMGKIVTSDIDNNDYLLMQNSPFEKGRSDLNDYQYFHLVRKDNEDNEFVDFGEEEEDEIDFGDCLSDNETPKRKKNDKLKGYWLCPHCGQILLGEVGKPKCGHPEEDMIKLKEVDNQDKCLFCSEGRYSGFYVGSDGATSVIGMSLFESLPTKICEINDNGLKKRFQGGKQFLCFSDSRSEAAFFACYESRIYDSFISRRGLVQYIKQIEPEIISHKAGYVTINELASGLAKCFEKNHSFVDSLADDSVSMGSVNIAKNYAWMITLDQLVGYNRKNYLQPMGYFQYVYRGITDEMIDYVHTKYLSSMNKDRIRDFLSVLAMTFARGGAIVHENLNIDEFYIKYVFKSTVQNCILEQKSKGTGSHNQSWIPQNLEGQTDKWRRSARQDLVKRVLKCDGKMANDFLLDVWKRYFTNPQHPFHAIPVGSYGGYAMPLDAFGVIVPGHHDAHWYRCDSCGKIFNYDIDGDCQVKNCEGHLHEIKNPKDYYKDNYYKKAYDGLYLRKLLIKEHTAQLGRQKGSSYQDEFASNKINALSCSTTFEMGVNLGHLETVFLRDMPPTAANYIQRAGRAGRSKEASAYAITYAKLSSHDFNYFANPIEMIGGKIKPPVLKESNQKIVYRHIFSVVLSYFFRQQENVIFFNSSDGKNTIGAFLDNSKGPSGYERLLKMIKNKPAELTKILKDSFGNNLECLYKISSYGEGLPKDEGWVDVLIGDSGRLSGSVNIFEETLKDITDESLKITQKAISESRAPNSNELKVLTSIGKKAEFLKSKQIVDFLVEANVLPKYGFPVDTVELKHHGSKSELSLSRDMSQAISEYAPGCNIIADGRMYTPRYVAKVVRAGKIGFDDGYYCQCGDINCKTPNFIYEDLPNQVCIGCGKTLAGINKQKAIQPSAGMIAETETKDVPSRKPNKLYSSEASYVGTFTNDAKKAYDVNGKIITIISTENDRIMVNTDPEHPFYVCQKCGYAVGKYDTVYKLDGSSLKKDTAETKKLKAGRASSIEGVHKTPNGGYCLETTLKRRLFVHNFNTDIVQILFNNEVFTLENSSLGAITVTGISILHALLFAVAKELEIEQNDINGCLIKNTSEEGTNYRFVIYDNVPGGAGHVKRIVKDNGVTLQHILKRAYDRMNCSCESSCYKCLKTYQNQRYHSVLSHQKAREFLENYQGTVTVRTVITAVPNVTLQFDSGGLSAVNWQQALNASKAFLSQKTKDCLLLLDNNHLPELNHINVSVSALGSSGKALLRWPSKKVLLLRKNDLAFYDLIKDSCDWKVFLPDDNFDSDAFNNSIK
ncbi:MAG: DEAD/DEAH box helicase [Bacilli bacterium]|nr:DEAD/DEAH box helicase [Bacilli bacterium]MDY3995019.1 DEAD/DEAH box helicase [Candidatus Onthovivens sp.]